MADFNIDILKTKLQSQGISNLRMGVIKDSIKVDFDEGFLKFNIDSKNKSFQILDYNIYKSHRFNPEESFKSISKEIILMLINYCKSIKFNTIEAINIRAEAINFGKV